MKYVSFNQVITYPVQPTPYILCNHISCTTTTIYPAQPPSDILFNQNQISGTTTTIYIVQQQPYILCSATTAPDILWKHSHISCAASNSYPPQPLGKNANSELQMLLHKII